MMKTILATSLLLSLSVVSVTAASAQVVPPPQAPSTTDVIDVVEDLPEAVEVVEIAEPKPPASDDESIYQNVEQMPSFPGGNQALFRYLQENLKYPSIAQANGIQGRTLVSFVVEKDGSITDIQVVRSAGDPSLDREAVRIIRTMPRWRPGKIQGQTVRVQYTVPINFKLQ